MRSSIIFLFVLLHWLPTGAQEVKFTASVSKNKVAVGEQFRLTYTINTNAAGFTGPDLQAFDVYTGPNQNFTFNEVNGRVTQSFSFFYIISAKRTGKLSIGPATVRVGNGKIQSNSIDVEVSNAASGNTKAGKKQENAGNQSLNNENLFIRAIVSKSSAYIGEPLAVTYKVYNRYPMVNFSDVKIPSFNGFYTEEIPMGKNEKSANEVINGVMYTTAEIKKTLLIPQKSGKLEIPSLDATFTVRERVQAQSIFDQLLGGAYRDVEVKIKSKPLFVEVMPLPSSGKPADFNGAVGQYSFSVSPGQTKLKSGDAFNLKITISGKGNLKLLENPQLDVPQEIEVYDPQVKDAIQVNLSGMSGSKTYEYLMIPRAGGNYKLGPFSFSYFDPQKRSYQTITAAALNLDVAKSAGESVAVTRSGSPVSTRVIGSDIRFNKTALPDFVPVSGNGFLFSAGYFALAGLPLLSMAGLLVFLNIRKKRREHGHIYKVKEAGAMAKRRLNHAKNLEKEKQSEAFYQEIFRAVYGYLSDKLQIPVAELSKDRIHSTLVEKQVVPEWREQLINLLNTCEFARFAPGADSGMEQVYQSAIRVITELENQIK